MASPSRSPSPDLTTRLARVRLLAMDVDGVLTDGRIYWGASPSTRELVEMKAFDVKDGLGISLARASGLEIGWITGRLSALVERRAEELGVRWLRQQVRDKGAALAALCADLGLEPSEAAYMADDLNDVPAFERAGVRISVADAAPEIRQAADWVTSAPGGRGAVREAIEAILRARGDWESARQRFLEALAEPRAGFDPLPAVRPDVR
jgi:3-deoxy-D-manno-octulosonate 8-phosphate phosphatase (KDO 8-P phosphatase)